MEVEKKQEEKRPLILYVTRHGSTKRTAGLLASAIGGEIRPLSDLPSLDLGAYGPIVLGAPIYVGRLSGIRRALRKGPLAGREAIAFGVGIHTPTEERREKLARQAGPAQAFFLFRGALDRAKLGFFEGLLLGALRLSLEGKKSQTPEDRELLFSLGHPVDFCGMKQLLPLVSYLNGIISTDKRPKNV